MPTLDQLTQAVRRQLLGSALTQEQVTELAAPMGASDTTFSVDPSGLRAIGKGLVEIGDELILVKSYDTSSGTVTVLGGTAGRGYAGTTAASHAAGELVTTAPAFPKADLKAAVNETIQAVYPDLVVLDEVNITCISVVLEYELPADAEGVWYVVGEEIGPSRMWHPTPNWRYNGKAEPTKFASGKSVQLLDGITPGMRYRVVYVKSPQPLAEGSDDFSATGYPASAVDAVKYGACARLAPAYEAGRLQQRAVESMERSQYVGSQTALRTAAYYQGLYETYLARERRRQLEELATHQTWQG